MPESTLPIETASFPRRLARRYPNLFASAFGLCAALAILVLAEGTAWLVLTLGYGPQPPNWHYFYGGLPLSKDHALYGFAPRKNATVRMARMSPDEIFFSVVCRTDAVGRRITPQSDEALRDKSALFFGCSFTFGEGVRDDETLPAQFAAHSPEYQVYNYGYMGYGPQQFYLQLDQDPLFEDVKQPVKLVVYTFMPHHIERLIGRMRLAATWCADAPCLVERDGKIKYLGSFHNSGLWRQRFYEFAERLSLLKLFPVNFPLQITPEHEAFTARVLAAAGEKVKRRFPEARFVILMYPRTHGMETAAAFRAAGLEVVSLDGIPPGLGDAPEYNFRDMHPNARSYAIVGEKFATYLQEHPAYISRAALKDQPKE